MTSPQANPGAGYPVSFRFPVTWSYLGAAPVAIAAKEPPPAKSVALTPFPVATQDVAVPGQDRWEMVVPRMTKPGRPRLVSPLAAVREYIPTFDTLSDSRIAIAWTAIPDGVRIAAVLTIVAGAAVGGWMIAQRGSARQPFIPVISAPVQGSWIPQKVYFAAGEKEGRRLVLYSSTQSHSDYRLEFRWKPEENGVGWVFRARDAGNYYAGRLRLYSQGATPTFAAERFMVFAGTESPRSQKLITVASRLTSVHVRLEIAGPGFTLYMDGNPVDYWTDQRFAAGGLGFFEERNHRPEIDNVQIHVLSRGGSR